MDDAGYRGLIEARLAELERLASSTAENAAPVELDQARVGRLSRMDAIQQQAMGAEARRRRKVEVMRLRAALRRLEDDRFGPCLECGEPIAEGRLRNDPGHTLCIECARAAEKR